MKRTVWMAGLAAAGGGVWAGAAACDLWPWFGRACWLLAVACAGAGLALLAVAAVLEYVAALPGGPADDEY